MLIGRTLVRVDMTETHWRVTEVKLRRDEFARHWPGRDGIRGESFSLIAAAETCSDDAK
jgi:hypothetical protein